ncbi:serine/threonine kinase [Pelomyxa schiedti]|nr:serine/threonine kinase [Pelomyxa schiedti]
MATTTTSSTSTSASSTTSATTSFVRPRVVVVGGGFAGMTAVRELERHKGNDKLMQLFMVDTKDFFENTSGVFKSFASPKTLPPESLQVLHTSYLRHAEFVRGEVLNVSPTHVLVQVEETMTIMLPFDYLVLASGCSYPLAKEPAVNQPFRLDWILKEAAAIASSSTVAIIGGGPTGVELCANIVTMHPGKRIYLIHSGKTILQRLPTKASEFVTDFLVQKGVQLLLGHVVKQFKLIPRPGVEIPPESEVDDDSINHATHMYSIVTNHLELEVDLAYMCAGPIPNVEYAKKHFPQCIDQGRLKVNKYLQLQGYNNIFVAGDITNIREEKLAERAIGHATIVAKNIESMIKGRTSLTKYTRPRKDPLYILSLGLNFAIAIEAGELVAVGEKPAHMKHSLETFAQRIFPPDAEHPTPVSKVSPKAPTVLSIEQSQKAAILNVFKGGLPQKVCKVLSKSCFTRVCLPTEAFDKGTEVFSRRSSSVYQLTSYDPMSLEDYKRILQDISLVFYECHYSDGDLTQLQLFLQAASTSSLSHVVFGQQYCSETHDSCTFYKKWRRVIRHSDLPYTLVRYDKSFYNTFMKLSKPRITLQRSLMLPLDPEEHIYLVDYTDIAKAISRILLEPSRFAEKEYHLRGPQALSGPEMAATISTVVLDEVRYIPITVEMATARLASNAKHIPESLYPCELFVGRAQEFKGLKTRKRSKAELLAPENEISNSIIPQIIGSPTFFSKWVSRKFTASAAGYEQQNLQSLQKRGGLRQIMSDAVAGSKTVHVEINPDDIVLGELIGSGAAGKVFRALYLGVPVAVKKIHEDFANFNIDEFRQEISLVCLLRHPNLVECIGACTQSPIKMYIVFELIQRGGLDSFLQQSTAPLPLSLQLRFALNVARGMHYLHSAEVCHRDLKDSNILVTDALQLKITDFGTAHPTHVEGFTETTGTPQFSAPEIFSSQPYSLPADCYAFGMILWEIVTRKFPFHDQKRFKIPELVIAGVRPPLPSSPFDKLIASCWNSNPKKRPSSLEILSELEKLSLPPHLPKKTGRRFSALLQFLQELTPFNPATPPTALPTLDMDLLRSLVTALRDPVRGIQLQEHAHMTETYPRCFTGQELVNWIVAHKHVTRITAIEAAEWLLLQSHVVHIIPLPSTAIEPFRDDSTLYGFP